MQSGFWKTTQPDLLQLVIILLTQFPRWRHPCISPKSTCGRNFRVASSCFWVADDAVSIVPACGCLRRWEWLPYAPQAGSSWQITKKRGRCLHRCHAVEYLYEAIDEPIMISDCYIWTERGLAVRDVSIIRKRRHLRTTMNEYLWAVVKWIF